MIANEAPEKIYFSANENGTYYYTEGIPFEREYIAYTRTDAFIDKACEWLKSQEIRLPNGSITFDEEFIDEFKNYMNDGSD